MSLNFHESYAQSIIKSDHVLDLLIRDYTFKSLDKNFKTGIPQSVKLPSNFSGIKVDTVRFRCGTYNADEDLNSSSNPFQLGIEAGEKLITIDFNNASNFNKKEENGIKVKPLCASFEGNGIMTLAKTKPLATLVCVAKRHGHFGLVVESLEKQDDEYRKPIRLSQWKVAVGSTIGAALGAFLLGLLLIAMLVRVKKRTRMVEMERRAYEEEALQVSMVGHVRAPTAPGTRTTPTLEQHDYITRHPR
ncbi:hypothetical protein TSUD_117470 [Trifolium subterraneum]|nr:hypothetical protein TSUD_117470 [Trifolium subterraneum]